MKETVKLGARKIDSFQPASYASHGHKTPTCEFKGCYRAGRVILFWREQGEQKQERSRVCLIHACELANDVLSVYKFNRGES